MDGPGWTRSRTLSTAPVRLQGCLLPKEREACCAQTLRMNTKNITTFRLNTENGEKNYYIIIFKHNYEVIYSLRNMYLLVNIRSALPLYIKSWCEVISRWQAAFHTCFRAPLPLIWWELTLQTLSHAHSKCGTKRPSCVATRLRCSHCRMYITVLCVNLWTKQTNQTTSLKVAGYRWPWHGQLTFDMLQRL